MHVLNIDLCLKVIFSPSGFDWDSVERYRTGWLMLSDCNIQTTVLIWSWPITTVHISHFWMLSAQHILSPITFLKGSQIISASSTASVAAVSIKEKKEMKRCKIVFVMESEKWFRLYFRSQMTGDLTVTRFQINHCSQTSYLKIKQLHRLYLCGESGELSTLKKTFYLHREVIISALVWLLGDFFRCLIVYWCVTLYLGAYIFWGHDCRVLLMINWLVCGRVQEKNLFFSLVVWVWMLSFYCLSISVKRLFLLSFFSLVSCAGVVIVLWIALF